MINNIITFFKEAKVELTKVNWLTRKQTINYTLLVIGISIAIALFLGGLDAVFYQLLKNFLINK
jgi:preprotein translocase subunit SecE